jgi:uncharacterized repeat protein (TIGR02543 family)
MRKKAWFFKNGTVSGILGVVLVFAMFAMGCPIDNTDPPPPPTYIVTFDTDGGSAIDNKTVEEGKTVTKPENPAKTDHTFANWYKDAEKTTLWNFDTNVIVQDTIIYAKWVVGKNVPSHKVTFNADGGAPAPADQSVVQGEKAQEPAKPIKSGFIFGGWYNGETQWNFGMDTVTGDVALKAKWTAAVTLTFVTNGGSAIAPVTAAKGGDVYLNSYRPTKDGHVFDGWYKNEALTQPAGNYLEKVDASLTLYAKWTSISELKDYAGVWKRSENEVYLLQDDGTAWQFFSSSGAFSFYETTWSTSQITGNAGTFNGAKTEFTGGSGEYSLTYTKATAAKTPTAATGVLLDVWISRSGSVELKSDKTAVVTYSDTITLGYCVESDKIYLLAPGTNIVIVSIDIIQGKPGSLSKKTSDSALAGIWKLTEGGQDYYWDLKADGNGTFHTLGASVSFSFTVAEDKKINGASYTISAGALTVSQARWDEEQNKYVDLVLTKAASVPAGSGADGDSRLHGTWKSTQGGNTGTITFKSDGVAVQSYNGQSASVVWKADGSTLYTYNTDFRSSRVNSQTTYSFSGSTLTLSYSNGGEEAFTKE